MSAETALRRIRIEHGYRSRRAFAKKLGVSPETPTSWERGTCKPHPRHAEKLVALLAMPLEQLLAPEIENGH
jgi:DNA-binding XRE family transcriptional regulator